MFRSLTIILVLAVAVTVADAAKPASMPSTQPYAEMKVRFDYPMRSGTNSAEGTDAAEAICKRMYDERYGDKPRLMYFRWDPQPGAQYQQFILQCGKPDAKEFLDVISSYFERL